MYGDEANERSAEPASTETPKSQKNSSQGSWMKFIGGIAWEKHTKECAAIFASRAREGWRL